MTDDIELTEAPAAAEEAPSTEIVAREQWTEEGQKPEEQDPGTAVKLAFWNTESETFWETYGKKVAFRNLYISIPNLTLAFATWIIWSVIAVKIQNVHEDDPTAFTFLEWDSDAGTKSTYKGIVLTLPAVAGLAGATLRMPNSFMISPIGGRNVIYLTSILMFVPMLWGGIALLDGKTTFASLVFVAALSGAGGGVFASSMSNISFFFPKKMQGLSLGLNGGIGNLGVSITQLIAPLFMALGSGIGIGYGLIFYTPWLAIFAFLAWWKMNNLPDQNTGSSWKAASKFAWLEGIGYLATLVGVGILIATRTAFNSPGLKILRFFIMVLACVFVGVILLKFATPEAVTGDLNKVINKQFEIFGNKHTHIMTYLYIMTFGSFIGFSAAFPGIIKNVFGYLPNGDVDPDAPEAFNFSWMGAAVGSLIRPLGGWLSDKYGGAFVTQISTIVLVASTIAVGAVVQAVQDAETAKERHDLFPLFVFLFLILFGSTGVGNGSTFRMVPLLFSKAEAGPVLGWISAMAAYGAFIIPAIFSVAISTDAAAQPFWGFAAYYCTCLGVNWWFYARKNAPHKC